MRFIFIHLHSMTGKKNLLIITTFITTLLSLIACKQGRYPEGLSPDDALQALTVTDGYKVELFASEPFVFDPVTMEFDENGNCYVALMPDAPFTPKPGEEKGQIRVLFDMNNDGRIDSSIVFADKLSEATSLLPWKGGLLVTAAPDILYLKDTNGDFRADVKEKLFTGFFKNNYETQISNLQFSVDNWIYANNRGQDGDVIYVPKPGDSSLNVKGGDFRFRLDRGQFENETGPGQFGQDIDFYGNRFITENSIPIQQMLVPWRYTHRHPYMPAIRSIKNISDHGDTMFQVSETPYWRAERTKKRNQEFEERKLNRVEYERGRFTGCSGGTFYVGDKMPGLYGNFFIGEVAGNLAHRDVLRDNKDSVYFTAQRNAGNKNSEFIYSKDTWFRPVNFTTGPDGYFYMLDFYRQHVETPVSIPEDLQKDMDFKKGTDKGRIYRIMTANATYNFSKPNIGKMSSVALAGLLSHDNGWHAITAHRLLVERQDKSVIPIIQNILNQSTSDKARLHALYVLEGLNALSAGIVKKAMQDPSPWVRYNAAILAERYNECYNQLVVLTKDTVAKVVLQATLSIGQFNNRNNIPVFIDVLGRYGYNKSFETAVLSTEIGSTPQFLKALLENPVSKTKNIRNSFIQDLAYIVGNRYNKTQIKSLIALATLPQIQLNKREASLLKGLLRGLESSINADSTFKAKAKQWGNLNDDDLKKIFFQNFK